ncbi:hypothetical protein KI655_00685 [Vibrio sp. D404a]|uniref:hypothetical protein n=1 Tax=unclassified Vibrio TaxID=2614977 RepID=UPI002554661D|nr:MULTISPECIES: hypothetical protein [unclassified Vibrio]MDK9735801.1 hypothetical protein [Vibrio sp. D404a]MDK9796665.1 hypothetical protein [Vibrio sp. D449a]
MAAQKLTKDRLVQIIVMLSILLAAFTWRTVTYTDNETVDCILSNPCEITIDKYNVMVSSDNLGYLIETSESNKIAIGYEGNGTLVAKSASSWLLTTDEQTSQITVTSTQQEHRVSVTLSK